MTLNLNLHARLAIERISLDLREMLIDYGTGMTPAFGVRSRAKHLRAQSRATRTIAPLEADAILGTAALVEILLTASERARDDNDINRSDDLVRTAIGAIDTLREGLDVKGSTEEI